jgi:hypothetical protein
MKLYQVVAAASSLALNALDMLAPLSGLPNTREILSCPQVLDLLGLRGKPKGSRGPSLRIPRLKSSQAMMEEIYLSSLRTHQI